MIMYDYVAIVLDMCTMLHDVVWVCMVMVDNVAMLYDLFCMSGYA